VLFHQREELSVKDCDDIRKLLEAKGESPHSAFANRRFEDGLTRFWPRLVDGDFPILGSSTERELGDDDRLTISSVQSSAAAVTGISTTLAEYWPSKPESGK
jgi:hypothetical protein